MNFRYQSAPVRLFLNLCQAALGAGLSLAMLLGHVRLGPAKYNRYLFAADYYSDPVDLRLYDKVSEYGNVLLIDRNANQRSIEGIEKFSRAHIGSGQVGFGTAAGLALDALCSYALFLRKYAFHDIRLFYLFCVVPIKRILIFSLFNENRVDYFFSRDDYNPEHIIRTDVLRTLGGCSLGITHGVPGYARRYPAWRYISFDRYYMITSATATHSMGDTWDPAMRLVPIGTRHEPASDAESGRVQQDGNIVVYCSITASSEKMIRFIRDLACMFTDRTIYVQVKPAFLAKPGGEEFLQSCRNGLGNVTHTRESPYVLFRRHRYGFSDPSTVILEGRQLGQYTFFADVIDEQVDSILRDFPILRVRNAREAAGRIRDIESASGISIEDGLGDLVHFTSTLYEDAIVEDLGLSLQLQQSR